jgi:hypothetical protein
MLDNKIKAVSAQNRTWEGVRRVLHFGPVNGNPIVAVTSLISSDDRRNMSPMMNDNNLKNALADLREVLSRSQADNSEVGELLKQMEWVVGEIETKTVPRAFLNNAVASPVSF